MRLFFALELGASGLSAASAAAARLKRARADVKWTDSPHLTLAFLGEQPPSRLEAAHAAGLRAAAKAAPFEAEFTAAGFFESRGRPRVVWLGVSAPPLAELEAALAAELARAGFALEDRQFCPHVTLGRIRTLRGVEALKEELAALARDPSPPWRDARFRVFETVLFDSRLGPEGASHEPQARIPLGARR